MLSEHFLRLLELSLDYLEENFDIKSSDIGQAEIHLAPLGSFQGSVLFPSLGLETFVSHWGTAPVVYWVNDYSEGAHEEA